MSGELISDVITSICDDIWKGMPIEMLNHSISTWRSICEFSDARSITYASICSGTEILTP